MDSDKVNNYAVQNGDLDDQPPMPPNELRLRYTRLNSILPGDLSAKTGWSPGELLKRTNSAEDVDKDQQTLASRQQSKDLGRRRSLAAAVRKVGCFPKQPVYGDDWNLMFQPAGSVQYIHWTRQGKELELSSFSPGLDEHRVPTYSKKRCKYTLNVTPEEAGFEEPMSKRLGQWTSTAIGGNDITSSIIFTAGLVAANAGYLMPFCLLAVVLLLYFFRTIYVELISALPLNGGTYTAMLNTTRKSFAMVAACLSFLSYSATAVCCAVSAMIYLKSIWDGMIVVVGTIVVLCAFAALMLIGLKESAIVATTIFFTHCFVLAVLAACSIAYAIRNKAFHIWNHYVNQPGPENPFRAFIFGFGNGMLGITGFESSSNFVQQQKPGVFSKTLRNMWIIVALINPTIGFLSFAVIPYDRYYEQNATELTASKEIVDSLLAVMADEMSEMVGGKWLKYVVIVDAIFVLCGSVLTGFVGVVGLLCRMVDDDIFPRSWTARTPKTNTQYPIILFFTAVCSGLVILTWGDIESVSGVFVICFLAVMFLFCLCNLIMKQTRKALKHDVRAKWYVVILCMCALIVALAGNCISDPIIIGYSALFISVAMFLFCCMAARTFLIRGILTLTEPMEAKSRGTLLRRFRSYLIDVLFSIEQLPVVFFTRNLDIREMNLAVQRVLSDELTRRLTFVHFYKRVEDIPESFNYERLMLDTHLFPNLQIDTMLIRGKFGPGAVRLTECILEVPPNRMFIGAPSKGFRYNVAQLGSVRIILGRDAIDEDVCVGPDGAFIGADNAAFSEESTDKMAASDVETPRSDKNPFRNRFFSIAGHDASYLPSTLTGESLSSAPSQVKKSLFKRQTTLPSPSKPERIFLKQTRTASTASSEDELPQAMSKKDSKRESTSSKGSKGVSFTPTIEEERDRE